MIVPIALFAMVAVLVVSCVVELPRDAGGRGDDGFSAPVTENPTQGSSQGAPPGHGGPNPGKGPDGAGPPGQDKDKGKGKDK